MTARGRHWLCGFGRPPEATQRRPAGAGERGSHEAGDRGPNGTGKGNRLGLPSPSKGEKEGEGASALGWGLPTPNQDEGGDSWSPLLRELSGFWQPRQPAALGSRQLRLREGNEWTRFGESSSVSISLDMISASWCALSELRTERNGLPAELGHFSEGRGFDSLCVFCKTPVKWALAVLLWGGCQWGRLAFLKD